MFRKLGCLATLLLFAACAPAPQRPVPPEPAPAPPVSETKPPVPGRPPPASATVSASEQRVIDATNAFRRANGLAPLKPSVRLIVIAQNHARNMARQDRFGDTDQNGHVLDGKGLDYRIKVGNYDFLRVAENVGFQRVHGDPVEGMMTGWKESPGHRRNMLLEDITEIGVGVAQGKSGRWYFVQVFGRPAPSAQPVKAVQ